MKKGKCSKYYPKDFQNETNFTDNGFTQYRRRDTNIYVRRDNYNLDNRYQAHINVEYVNKSKLLKYLCKYVNKEPDKATIIFERIRKGEDTPINKKTRDIDKIKEYLDCRYICEQDALWRLLSFDIHYHWPHIERLPAIAKDPKYRKTKLTAWFEANENYEEAREITYCEFSRYWRWDGQDRKWIKRHHGFKIGRLYYVNPAEDERFYLRMLLMTVKCAKDYKDIRIYSGIIYQTFKEACVARGLLQDDNERYKTFDETANWTTSLQLRYLFTTMILFFLTVALSGVASLLLPNGRTTHSRFRIPVDIDEISMCDIKRRTKLAELLSQTDLIIWDEALMTNRQCFEALDRSLRDILCENDTKLCDVPFGGKDVLEGDPKQILPVIENANKAQIINASIFRSYIWNHVNKIYLNQNMRLKRMQPGTSEYKKINKFNDWILTIGNRTIKHEMVQDVDEDPDCSIVDIPDDLLINTSHNKIKALVEATYPDFQSNYNNANYIKNRAILATTNDIVDEINNYMTDLIPGIEIEYFSADSISKCTDAFNDANILYPVEYFNTLNTNNFPSHRLKLKIGVLIMLLRNLNQSVGLCNGTRLIITNLGHNVIEAVIITGTHVGDKIYIPRINLTTRGSRWPFTLCRRQFSINVCYYMTINKSQGQTLSNLGVYLKKPVFTHGQLYVAVSRVHNRSRLKILIENSDRSCGKSTKNIVYKDILEVI
ncbi:hypothetical protein BS78_10G184200 [Paspalum vaginatum]|nr:hypothetical protein BS78_10G184200 [Paspalum vaginatum]